MDSPEFSMLSSLRGDFASEDFIQPHYKEAYRLAIDHLVKGGRDSYQEFLKGERLGSFLSEDELLFITTNTKQLPPQNHTEDVSGSPDTQSSSGTYWPVHSDVQAPDLDLGWPEVMHEKLQTHIDLLFHPPRLNSPTIKEVIRKHIQDARQVVGIVMDMFTDVDIFREIVDASIRGVPVYVLLDDFHLKSFVTMAENQDVKIQQLRNMRVRTVKGQDYLCRSGATFHGAMKQKFLLVDCHTAIYGSYSFAWSFEKINLSMVQVIKGHLVKSYDEEFRTLYARSTVPPQLCPPEGCFQRNGPHGPQNLLKSHSGPKLERRNQLRHSLDAVYRKTCERKFGTRDLEETLFEDEAMKLQPLLDNGFIVQDQVSRFQPSETVNFLKRHSYAGEGQDGHTPQNMRPRASNWNIRETENGPNHYPVDNYLQPHMSRGQNMRQSYNGIDKQVLSVQQNMPTLENTSKSFMRTWRIESYLKNDDMPFGDSCDYLDQFEPMDKNGSFMQGRMRSSLVMRSTIPEQMEPYRYMNKHSTGVGSSPAPLHYSSMQWNPTASAENRMNNGEFMLTRPSLENSRNNASFGPGRNSYQAAYASLGQAKGGQIITNPEILGDGWHKRHSVADPRSNADYAHEPSGPVYGGLGRMNRSTAGMNAQNGEYGSNLNEDQRSLSHYDVKNITSANSPNAHKWPEPPSRAVSAAALDVKANGMSSQHCSRNNSSKVKSLLNIPERKEDAVGNVETASLTSGGSTDTLTGGDEEKAPGGGGTPHQSKTSSEQRGNPAQVDVQPSKPRLRTEDPKAAPQKKPSIFDRSTRTGLDRESWRRERGADSRLYSRFEPLCSFEKKPSARPAPGSGSAHPLERSKSLPKADPAAENSLSRPARGHHENRLERFFQRMGSLIHKNK